MVSKRTKAFKRLFNNLPDHIKENARKQYIDRQINKWVMWSWKQRGRVKYKELIAEIERVTEHAGKRKQ